MNSSNKQANAMILNETPRAQWKHLHLLLAIPAVERFVPFSMNEKFINIEMCKIY